MSWWRKDKKPRRPRRESGVERLEIPADVWEKCEACGHTDLREKFVRNLNVCPACDNHRRIRAQEYADILLDEGTAKEVEADLRSTDPLGFPEYTQRLKKASSNAGERDAMFAVTGTLGDMPVSLGVMDFAFMGGSHGVGRRREDRAARPAVARAQVPAGARLGIRRRPHAGGGALADADGQDVGHALAARRTPAFPTCRS